MSVPVHTFVSAEETKRAFTVTYRTEAGNLEKIILGRSGDKKAYQLASLGLGGRHSDETKTVDLLLRVDGAPGGEVFRVVDKEGNTIRPGVFITHYVRVEAPRKDAERLTDQLSVFMHSADYLVERRTSRRSKINGINYGDDHITISYDDGYRALKLGLPDSPHRFTLFDHGIGFDPDTSGAVYMTFGFLDENG